MRKALKRWWLNHCINERNLLIEDLNDYLRELKSSKPAWIRDAENRISDLIVRNADDKNRLAKL